MSCTHEGSPSVGNTLADEACQPICADVNPEDSSYCVDKDALAEESESIPKPCATAPKTKSRKAAALFNGSHCLYDCVVEAAEGKGWRCVRSEAKAPTCNVHWIDDCAISDWFRKIEPWMRINHFPGMHNALARKSRLARNMSRMQRLLPSEYSFLPDTWVLPDDLGEIEKQFKDPNKAKAMYIVKPDAGTQGRGIFLTNDWDRIRKAASERDVLVVQRYLSRPMLIEGMKFDLRLYLLVSGSLTEQGGIEPRYFLFRDGLVRLCTTEYVAPTMENLHEKRMHLTNYAINKKSSEFVQNDGDDDGAGSKRSLRWFLEFVAEEHGEQERDKLWTKLKNLCVKMMLAVHPTLEVEYRNAFPKDLSSGSMGCRSFEVLGVDVMCDSRRRPYLIEVNHLPSFTCDSPLDQDIKSRVVEQTLELVCDTVSSSDRQTYEALAAERSRRGSCSEENPQIGDSEKGSTVTEEPRKPNHLVSSLSLLAHKDFERVYPAPPEAKKLDARYTAILSRVSEVFRPVAASHARPSSSSERRTRPESGQAGRTNTEAAKNGATTLPPRPPVPRATAPTAPPRGANAMAPIVGRSRSAPVPKSQRRSPDLPVISSSRSPSPAGSPSEQKRPASREVVSRLRASSQRASLPMKNIQIGF